MKVRLSHRHLLNDLVPMLPHSRKDAKQNTKSKLYYLNEIADLHNCNNILFFEARKRGRYTYLASSGKAKSWSCRPNWAWEMLSSLHRSRVPIRNAPNPHPRDPASELEPYNFNAESDGNQRSPAF